ncbi:hypothetical protein B0H13DRAFT_1881101 [Mycena leptocephala]|nr:hypothetical protein B0H13DRAFT_1881101 [Mycena leptocephala]
MPLDPAIKVMRSTMFSIESPVEKGIMPLSEIWKDGILQNDQGYPFPNKTGPEDGCGTLLELKSIPRTMNSASAPAHPAVKVTRFKMAAASGAGFTPLSKSRISKCRVEKAIIPLSEIFRDGIVQNDQGYPLPKNRARRWLWDCAGIEINPKGNEFSFGPGSPHRQSHVVQNVIH